MRAILVLFDSHGVRGEAVHYSIELAKRTDSQLIFLGLLPNDALERESGARIRLEQFERMIRNKLCEYVTSAENEEVVREILVRVGDPQSELMKFLAGLSSIRAIVWAGREDLRERKASQKETHWLVRTQGMLECPVVVPSIKA